MTFEEWRRECKKRGGRFRLCSTGSWRWTNGEFYSCRKPNGFTEYGREASKEEIEYEKKFYTIVLVVFVLALLAARTVIALLRGGE